MGSFSGYGFTIHRVLFAGIFSSPRPPTSNMWSGPSSLPKLMVSSKPVLKKPNHARTVISPSIGSLLPTSQQAKEHATGFSNPLLGNSLCATFPFQTAKGKQTTSLGSNSPTKMIELKETPPATGIWPTSKWVSKVDPLRTTFSLAATTSAAASSSSSSSSAIYQAVGSQKPDRRNDYTIFLVRRQVNKNGAPEVPRNWRKSVRSTEQGQIAAIVLWPQSKYAEAPQSKGQWRFQSQRRSNADSPTQEEWSQK